MSGRHDSKSPSGGRRPRRGAPAGNPATRTEPGEKPSKTALKARSTELQKLGEQLLTLPAASLADLALPATLADALQQLAGIRDFEGARRQRQWVGKLMRTLDPEQVSAIRATLDVQKRGMAGAAMRLHAAERWRTRLLAHDDAVTEWMQQHPACDVQHLRQLLRQARRQPAADATPGRGSPAGANAGARQAARQLFRLLSDTLAGATADPGQDTA